MDRLYWKEEIETISPATLRRLENEYLQTQPDYVWTYSAFYQARFAEAGVKREVILDLADLPVPARREGVPMSGEKSVLSTVANKVARVVMNRPGVMNAMSRGLISQLRLALEHAQDDLDISLIVLSGAGGTFCAGEDLKEANIRSLRTFWHLFWICNGSRACCCWARNLASPCWMAMPWAESSSWHWPAMFASPAHGCAWDV